LGRETPRFSSWSTSGSRR